MDTGLILPSIQRASGPLAVVWVLGLAPPKGMCGDFQGGCRWPALSRIPCSTLGEAPVTRRGHVGRKGGAQVSSPGIAYRPCRGQPGFSSPAEPWISQPRPPSRGQESHLGAPELCEISQCGLFLFTSPKRPILLLLK